MPPLLAVDNVTEGAVAASDMVDWLGLYKEGVLTGRITPPPPAPACLMNASQWFAYLPDWDVAVDGGSLRAKAIPSFNCKEGALLKKCRAKSTTLPPADVRCYTPGTVVQLKVPPQSSGYTGLLLVEPLLPLLSPERHSIRPVPSATRAQLSAALEGIYHGSASCAVAASSVSRSAGEQSFTLAQLAHVVTRHAACIRERLHAEDIMGVLGLKPYTFRGDV